jgi:hypothetical protein
VVLTVPWLCSCREQILERKRREYRDLVPEYYDIEATERSEDDNCALRQVCVLRLFTAHLCSWMGEAQLSHPVTATQRASESSHLIQPLRG